MRATLFVQEGPVEVKVVDSSKEHMFIVLELNSIEFFFPGYGQENVDYVRGLAEKLAVAADTLQDKVMEELCSPEKELPLGGLHDDGLGVSGMPDDGYRGQTRKLTRTERHQGQADNGQDTLEEARGER